MEQIADSQRRFFLAAVHERGTAAVEMALVVYLLFMLFAGLIDVSFLFREQTLASETARNALRAVLTAQPMPKVISRGYSSYLPSDAEKCTYITERYQRAVELGRYLLRANRLDPNNYELSVFNSVRQIQSRRYKLVNLRITPKSTSDRLFLFFNESAFSSAQQAAALIEGVPAEDQFDDFVNQNGTSSGCG